MSLGKLIHSYWVKFLIWFFMWNYQLWKEDLRMWRQGKGWLVFSSWRWKEMLEGNQWTYLVYLVRSVYCEACVEYCPPKPHFFFSFSSPFLFLFLPFFYFFGFSASPLHLCSSLFIFLFLLIFISLSFLFLSIPFISSS